MRLQEARRFFITGITLLLISLLLAGCVDMNTVTYEDDVWPYAENNCTLTVNGREITSEVRVHMDAEKQEAVIPLLAVMRELGATVVWEDEINVSIICGTLELDLEILRDDFGLPVADRSPDAIRWIIEKECYVNTNSIQYLFDDAENEINLEIDFENAAVNISNSK